jgi:lysophospholipid acyltransferase (LPLAT)-like uncharacterized protein
VSQFFRRLARSPTAQQVIGIAGAEYLRFVWRTSRLVIEPADLYEVVQPELPVIVAMWHGQHFMVPFLRRGHRVKVLISRHRDGEINAIAANRLGVMPIRGSGDHGRRFDVKGGVGAFRNMLNALEEGYNVALTADIPKVARIAGFGIVMLSKESGRPIFPVAVATSRRIVLDNWDASAINLPFSRIAIVAGAPVKVPAQADHVIMEHCREAVERGLTEVTRRAYEIVDHKDRHANRG